MVSHYICLSRLSLVLVTLVLWRIDFVSLCRLPLVLNGDRAGTCSVLQRVHAQSKTSKLVRYVPNLATICFCHASVRFFLRQHSAASTFRTTSSVPGTGRRVRDGVVHRPPRRGLRRAHLDIDRRLCGDERCAQDNITNHALTQRTTHRLSGGPG